MLKNLQLRWYKLTHWEFWPFWAIYGCILPWYLVLSIRARSFFFFGASNPNIEFAGFLMESKWKIYEQMPPGSFPTTVFVDKKLSIADVLMKAANISFPCIAKPDIGGKGRGVVVLYQQADLFSYHQQCPVDYLLQEQIQHPLEAGIFFVKNPANNQGILTGIVEKIFLQVTGNGHSSIRQLLMKEKRYALQLPALEHLLGEVLNEVLPVGENKVLAPIGNHARGALFLDASYRINTALTAAITALCNQIPEFYFGRLDIRFASWEALEKGEQLSVIELNGAGSEPTHMYHPSNSLFTAWKEIIKHWNWLFYISKYNHTQYKYPYISYKQGLAMLKNSAAYDAMLDAFQFSYPATNNR
jgi:hypothetical protein